MPYWGRIEPRLAPRGATWSIFRMFRRIARLFVIETRIEACFVIYALGLGAVLRGQMYLDQYPGTGGRLLFAACLGAVFMAGAKLMEATRRKQDGDRRASDRRRSVR